MEIKINVTPEDVKDLTHTTASIPYSDVTFKGSTFDTQECKPMFANFAKTAVDICKAKHGIAYNLTMAEATRELVDWITVMRTPDTEAIFEPFKRLGIYLSKLQCGVSTTGDMYVAPKMTREFNRLSEKVAAEAYLYLYSLTRFVANVQAVPFKVETSKHGSCEDFSITSRNFVEYLPTVLSDGGTFYVKDIASDNLSKITYNKSVVSEIESTYTAAKPFTIAILERDGVPSLGLVTLTLASNVYTFVVGDGKVVTDYELCMLEMANDSLCTGIVSAMDKSVVVTNLKEIRFAKDLKVADSEDVDALLNACPDWLNHWLAKMLTNGAEFAETSTLGYLKKYGIAFDVSACSTDPEEIIKQYESDEYAQQLYKQVQPYYSTFDLGNVASNVKGFSTGAIYSMAFIGESGTGKSTAARVLPYRCGFPYVSVNFSVNIEESDLFGAMIPNPNKKCADDPEFVWQDGIITKAVRNGYCAILEEINFARPGVLGKLNSLLDENRQIDLSNGEIVRAHKNFRMIATCNIAYEGTNRFNKALINRFDDVTVFEDPSREAALRIVRERTGYSNTVKLAKVYDVYEALKKFSKEQGVHAVVSMRQLLNVFSKGKFYKDAKDAVMRVMLNGAFIEDAEYKKVFEETILPAFDLKFKI